ncbi:hypothetical protein DSCW_18010 [Desulfosarcina widdelii]|uniref:Uncharacterized protein n=1 Tax=Desulfosarcina widdelii TaxID=947919 RepID=A0A5K7Z7D5_9BACT|nr:hypothetical protein [Desulfosarcina widdelii]BBO74384.1 hypothetical protein DSCW_18010 [Desulfosarcina widdelii]
MRKPPCIRGLKEFKKGCPQRSWNGEDGCPAWVEADLKAKDGGNVRVAECLDLYRARLHWHTNALLLGNQQATESFRNNMTETDHNGNGRPKPDPAVMALIGVLDDMQKSRKLIEQNKLEGGPS